MFTFLKIIFTLISVFTLVIHLFGIGVNEGTVFQEIATLLYFVASIMILSTIHICSYLAQLNQKLEYMQVNSKPLNKQNNKTPVLNDSNKKTPVFNDSSNKNYRKENHSHSERQQAIKRIQSDTPDW